MVPVDRGSTDRRDARQNLPLNCAATIGNYILSSNLDAIRSLTPLFERAASALIALPAMLYGRLMRRVASPDIAHHNFPCRLNT